MVRGRRAMAAALLLLFCVLFVSCNGRRQQEKDASRKTQSAAFVRAVRPVQVLRSCPGVSPV